MKIGFIGTGNMASAIIKAIDVTTNSINLFDVDKEKVKELEKLKGVRGYETANELVQKSDVVMICVKPNMVIKVLEGVKDDIKRKNPIIISIAAATSIDTIEKACGDFSPFVKVVRTMPNINAQVKESMTAICYNTKILEEDKQIVREIFNNIGKFMEIKEDQFSVFSAVAGCSPAFVYLFIDSLARAAHKSGFSRDMAVEIATQAVMGSAKMLSESKEHPWVMIDKVCSPGGTTIEGINMLLHNNFQSDVIDAVDASIKKDNDISKR